ncbi:MAG: GGDEF domain-containing protein [Oscillospiraceae bacterium]
MTHRSKLQTAATIAYAIVAAFFILFFVYMNFLENVSVQKVRDSRFCHAVGDYSMEEVEDPAAPIGVRKEYRWMLGEIGANDTTLAFYLVHQCAEVYIDDELVYSLMPQATNRVSKGVSSNWAEIPLYPGDSGKEVCVIVTPVYESVRNRAVVFQLGSLYRIYFTQLKADLPQLILSAVCFVLGLLIMLVQLVLILRRKSRHWDIFFLGNFTMILGLWKITDTRFSPLMFAKNTLVLGYLSIGALFLAAIPLGLYLKDRFAEYKTAPVLAASLIASGGALIALSCQVFDIAEFRQTLSLAHIIIVLMALSLLAALFAGSREKKSRVVGRPWGFALLLIIGVLADLIIFYVSHSSSGLVFSLLAVLIYTLAQFGISILETNRKASTDTFTGLFNKSRWDTLLDYPDPISKPIGMIMFDLNHLKYTNDTMGHEAGDKVIFAFANILRNTIPPENTICRWGGDEFAVMIANADRETMELYLEKIDASVSAYNEQGEKPALYYAAGYALSSEFPGLSRKELFRKADERMYRNKQLWYSKNSVQ